MKLQCTFALLDVMRGRRKLAAMMPPGSKHLPKSERIPVTIHGYISHQHGGDDGTSIEFGVDVERVDVGKVRP